MALLRDYFSEIGLISQYIKYKMCKKIKECNLQVESYMYL